MGICQTCNGLGMIIYCGGATEINHSYNLCPSCNGTNRKIFPHCHGAVQNSVPEMRRKEGMI